jgi:branched-chain amino acid transport system permease protein
MTPLSRPLAILLLTALACLLALPLVADRFYLQLATQIMTTGLFAMSLDLLVGYTGLVSFGHAAYFGLAGYALAILGRDLGLVSLWATLPLCLAVSGLAALAIGALSIRTSGVFFIMITLAFAQMLYFFFNDSRSFGGSDGLYVDVRPTLEIGGWTLLDLDGRIGFYYFTLFWLVASYLLLRILLASPFGLVLAGIRANEGRTRALGYPTQRYKLASFVIAGMLAGLAGYLAAAQFGVVNPAHLSWRQSGHALIIVILGGMGTLHGPVLGAFVLVFLEDLLMAATEHWLLVMGLFVIAVVVLLPHGLAGLASRLVERRRLAVPSRLATAPLRFREARRG